MCTLCILSEPSSASGIARRTQLALVSTANITDKPRQRRVGRAPIGVVWGLGAVARTTVTIISEPRGAIQATSLRDSPSLRFNPSKNRKKRGKINLRALDRRGHKWVSRPPGPQPKKCIKRPCAGNSTIEAGRRSYKGNNMAVNQISEVISHL